MPRPPQKTFHEEVALPYRLYNSLFLTLPFRGVHQAGPFLPLLSQDCKRGTAAGQSPQEIIESFFEERLPEGKEEEQRELLFNFIQYIERQVVLFDAIEDASFEKIYDLQGPGTLEELLSRVQRRDAEAALAEVLAQFQVRIVLTAHPTQFYPGEVLGIITDLEAALRAGDLAAIENRLLQLGKTPFINQNKPTPYDEASDLTWYLENVFYEAIPGLIIRLQQFLKSHGLDPDLAELLKMGFWPGGDRDGNPYVDSQTTLRVAQRLRNTVLRCHYRALRRARRELTFRGVHEALLEIEKKLYHSLYPGDVPGYETAETLISDLEAVQRTLEEEHQGLFADRLEELLARIRCFKFHFATLDLRQDSRVHQQVWHEILELKLNPNLPSPATWEQLDAAARQQCLLDAHGHLEPAQLKSAAAQDVVGSLQALQTIQQKNGYAGMHRYIISNCQTAEDVLLVQALARLSGLPAPLPFQIVPLFETVDDLAAAPAVMESLYTIDRYQALLRHHRQEQVIMLGFSDGTKDGGYLQANWSIYQAKAELTRVSRAHEVKVIFFDGRGGPPARGGGNTHKFYASLGQHVEQKAIELTIQGQTISSKFGNQASAQFNLEQLLTAGVSRQLFPHAQLEIDPAEQALIEELAAHSYGAYQELKNHPCFLDYLKEITTLPYYGQTNIGSRPVKRKGDGKLRFEDLRAIPFVGSWSQMKQNVPGFFGWGSALKKMDAEGRLGEVKTLYREVGFFKALVNNSLMALAKTNFALTSYLKEHPQFGPFWQKLHQEYQDSLHFLKAISDQKELLQNNPITQESVKLREELVLPLIVIQQYALQKIQRLKAEGASDKDLTVWHKLVMRSMFGNINATRNAA